MYSDTYSMVKINVHLSELFSIACSLCQSCLLSPLLYVLALELLLQNLEELRGLLFEIGLKRAVSAYVDDATVMVSDTSKVEMVSSIVRKCEPKINVDKQIDLQLGI